MFNLFNYLHHLWDAVWAWNRIPGNEGAVPFVITLYCALIIVVKRIRYLEFYRGKAQYTWGDVLKTWIVAIFWLWFCLAWCIGWGAIYLWRAMVAISKIRFTKNPPRWI